LIVLCVFNLSITNYSEQKVEIPLIPTFWATRQLTQSVRAKSSDDSGTFLTGINNEFEQQDEDEDSISQSKPSTSPALLYGSDENSIEFNLDLEHLDHLEEKKKKSLHKSISTPANIQQHPMLPLINSVSTLDLLKIRQNYSKIYTNRFFLLYLNENIFELLFDIFKITHCIF